MLLFVVILKFVLVNVLVPDIPVPASVVKDINIFVLKLIGNVTVYDAPVKEATPPWVQDGNGADPDERSGSFTEKRQNWNRRYDAERRNFQQN